MSSTLPPIRGSNPPLGADGDHRRRVLFHHVPFALAAIVFFLLWMTVPIFQTAGHQGPPQAMQHAAGAAGHQGPDHASGHQARHLDGLQDLSRRSGEAAKADRAFMARVTTATGYIAVGFLALTLLVGPVNLLVGRRNPVSSYLRRDGGAWTATSSAIHVIAGLQVHGPPVPFGERILHYFFRPGGGVLTDSFGLGNWTGLVALVIVLLLLAISSDAALRALKAGPWKWLQRLNYALFVLVVAHAIFYGALLRMTSPSTLLLGVSLIAVGTGQVAGIWLWRRRRALTQGIPGPPHHPA